MKVNRNITTKGGAMHRTKVAILGSSGMLGSMVKRVFAMEKNIELICPRQGDLDARYTSFVDMKNKLRGVDWIINCIGIIKQIIDENNSESIINAIEVNSLFPRKLARLNIPIIQIETDCVYDGLKGDYLESDPHNPTDVYGKTKSLGEVKADNVYHIRTSIIGPNGPKSLMDWVLNQPKDAKINGYLNHEWNGITTLHFAKVCLVAVQGFVELNHIQHFVPATTINKNDLIKTIAEIFGRQDITINEIITNESIDRTLATNNAKKNLEMWWAVGYDKVPSIKELLIDLKNN